MGQVQPNGSAVRFGIFELDLRAGELRKQGVKVKLQDQPFQILQVLLERPGELVTREELQQRIWPAETFVDFDHGLYNAIKRLRKALGDSAESPRYIETLSRRGYRFIGSLNGSGGVEVSTPQPVSVGTGNAFRSRSAKLIVGAVIPALVLFGLVLALNPNKLRESLMGRTDTPPIRSLAVLPFQNLSDDPAQEYFANGMTEELVTALSGITALRVVSRTSVWPYKNTSKSLPEIARELNVDSIVAGSVRRDGNTLRVTVQLVYAPQDKNVWAQNYERKLQDLLGLQDEIAGSIVNEIRVRLTPQERQLVSRHTLVRPTTTNAYLAGAYFHDLAENEQYFRDGERASPEDLKTAIGFYEQAIREDPKYALAYIGLSDALLTTNAPRTNADVSRAEAAIWKALTLDDSLPEAHIALSRVFRFHSDWLKAEDEIRKAVTLAPNSPDTHQACAEFLDQLGRFDESWKEHQRSQELKPNNDALSAAFFYRRQYDKAIESNRKWLRDDSPGDGWGMFYLGAEYERAGQQPEAIAQWKSLLDYLGYKDIEKSLEHAYATAGYEAALRALADGYEEKAKHKYFPRDVLAYSHALTGDTEGALAWLRKAISEHDQCILYLKVSPFYDPIRSDPRFQELVVSAGFPPSLSSQARNMEAAQPSH